MTDTAAAPTFTAGCTLCYEQIAARDRQSHSAAHVAGPAMLAALEVARVALDLAYRRDHPGASQYGRALGIVEAAIAQARGGEAGQP